MVKPKLTFFKMQVEGAGGHTAKPNQACFRIAPESFNAIDVSVPFGKFVLAVIDAKMFAITYINQAIVATPAVRVDDALQLDSAPDHRLERGFRAIWNDFRVNVTVPLKDAEDYGFAKSTPASFAFDATGAKERFVDFNLP